MTNLYIINFNGEKEPFSLVKVYRSARRVGACKELAEKITGVIQKEAYPGIKTSSIFQRIKELLYKESPNSALKFNLKQGIKKLGPTGFPFEKYIGEIFSKNGFKVKLNQFLPGVCCNEYEIDFLAQKDNLIYIAECKFRNMPKAEVHSKTALANYARFLDIKKNGVFNKNNFKKFEVKSLLVTNNRFTGRAIKYSNCVGVELLGWKYPKNKGLERLIDDNKLYPITILPSLKGRLIKSFVSHKIMLAQDVLKFDSEKLAKKIGVRKKELAPLIKEAETLLG